MKPVFTEIYVTKKWWNGSGQGSEPKNVVEYCDFLNYYLAINHIKTVVDVGCGDWKFSQYINWENINYIGIDVVSSVIDANNKLFATDNISFICMNTTEEVLPKADLVILKDVLQHWPNETIRKYEDIIRQYPHSLIVNTIKEYNVTNPEHKIETTGKVNRDIPLGGVRPLDLSLPPFSWDVKEVFRYTYTVDYCKRQDVKSVVSFMRNV